MLASNIKFTFIPQKKKRSIPANHLHAAQTPFANNKTEQARAPAYQAIKATHTKDVVPSAFLAQIARPIKHVSEINAKTHALVFAVYTLLVPL